MGGRGSSSGSQRKKGGKNRGTTKGEKGNPRGDKETDLKAKKAAQKEG
jgi:hypothetical protein